MVPGGDQSSEARKWLKPCVDGPGGWRGDQRGGRATAGRCPCHGKGLGFILNTKEVIGKV